VVGGAARPGSRRGLPLGVTVFANARTNKTTSLPCIAPRVQKTRATATLRQRHIPPNVMPHLTTLSYE